jgi:hypothetical protein
VFFDPSRVRARPLAAGRNEGGTILGTFFFFSSSYSSWGYCYSKTPEGVDGGFLTNKISGKQIIDPPPPFCYQVWPGVGYLLIGNQKLRAACKFSKTYYSSYWENLEGGSCYSKTPEGVVIGFLNFAWAPNQ